jgi:tetratricopeptide (TPR) repeat protein
MKQFAYFNRLLLILSLLGISVSVNSPCLAETVLQLPSQAIQLSLRDSTEILAPARAAFDAGNLQKAKDLLKAAATKSPYLPHGDIQLALWFFNANLQAKGTATMERLAMEEADQVDVRYLFAEVALGQGRYFDAWTHASAGLDAKPRQRWAKEYASHLNMLLTRVKAKTANARGDWQASMDLFGELRRLGYADSGADLAQGRAAFMLGDIDKALDFFRNAASRPDTNIIPELAIASMYDGQGDDEKTEEWFRRCETLEAQSAEGARLEYVRWLLKRNRSADARRQASRLRPSDERRRDFEYMIGATYKMEGDFRSAEKIFTRLHREYPDSFQVTNQLALTLVESDDEGKRGRALQLASKNVKAAPKSAESLSTFAWIKHRLGESEEAEKVFNLILRGGQASRDTAFYVAKVKMALKKEKEARLLKLAAKQSEGVFFNAFRVDD